MSVLASRYRSAVERDGGDVCVDVVASEVIDVAVGDHKSAAPLYHHGQHDRPSKHLPGGCPGSG